MNPARGLPSALSSLSSVSGPCPELAVLLGNLLS